MVATKIPSQKRRQQMIPTKRTIEQSLGESVYKKKIKKSKNHIATFITSQVNFHTTRQSGEKPRTPARTLLPHQIHLILIPVVDLELREVAGGLRDHPTVTNAAGVREELLLEVLGDPLLDDDVVGVHLVPVPVEAVGQ